jgi:DNA polymerase III subunit gamma/tau
VQEWAKAWRPSRGHLRPQVSAEIARRDAASALKFHWKAALWLLSGIGNDITEWDDRYGKWRPVRELLGIDRDHEGSDAKILSTPLIILSERLARSSVKQACRNGLEPLSAFDDRAWDWVTSGWEVDEHIDRRHTRRERENDIRAVEVMHSDDPELIVPSIQSLAVTWPSDPHDRTRSWLGWWSPLGGE